MLRPPPCPSPRSPSPPPPRCPSPVRARPRLLLSRPTPSQGPPSSFPRAAAGALSRAQGPSPRTRLRSSSRRSLSSPPARPAPRPAPAGASAVLLCGRWIWSPWAKGGVASLSPDAAPDLRPVGTAPRPPPVGTWPVLLCGRRNRLPFPSPCRIAAPPLMSPAVPAATPNPTASSSPMKTEARSATSRPPCLRMQYIMGMLNTENCTMHMDTTFYFYMATSDELLKRGVQKMYKNV